MVSRCAVLLALGAVHALRTPSRVTMSTLEKTKPRAPVKKTTALPFGSKNNVLKIPYTVRARPRAARSPSTAPRA